jgi:hypothetical protein
VRPPPPCPPIFIHSSGIGRLCWASLVPPIYQTTEARPIDARGDYTSRRRATHTTASVADQAGTGRGGGAGGAGHSLGSPVSERHSISGISNRKRNASLAGFDSSPGTVESPEADASDDGHHGDRRKQPVKRACNECRQQKVSHSPIGGPS